MNLREETEKPDSELSPDIYKQFGRGEQKLPIKAFPDKNLPAWSYKAVSMKLSEAYHNRKRPLLIFGAAGIGKSQVVEAFARKAAILEHREFKSIDDLQDEERKKVIANPEEYYILLDLRAGELNPEQSQGIPDVEFGKKEGYLRFLPPDWVKLMSNPKFSGLIFLDELNRASEMTLNNLLKFVLDRTISGHRASEHATIVAASNLGPQFVGTTALDDAMMSRFTAGVLVADIHEWVSFARKFGVSKYIIDFALANPADNFLADGKNSGDHNQPINPRNLIAASHAMKAIEQDYLQASRTGHLPEIKEYSGDIYQDIQTSLSGDLGIEWVGRFIEWLRTVHAFQWDDILRRAELKQGDKERLSELGTDKSWALVRYITDKVLGRYDVARKQNDEKEKAKIKLELYTILNGISNDQIGFLIKRLSHGIRDARPPGVTIVQANLDWNQLMTGTFDVAVAKKNQSLQDKIRALTTELQKAARGE